MPPPANVMISGFIAGDKVTVERIVKAIPIGRTLIKAWLTIKSLDSDPDPGLVQKVITTTAVPGVGQIFDIGTDGEGVIVFELTPTDTGTSLTPNKAYPYDIQLKFDNGDIGTLERGAVHFILGVTAATS